MRRSHHNHRQTLGCGFIDPRLQHLLPGVLERAVILKFVLEEGVSPNALSKAQEQPSTTLIQHAKWHWPVVGTDTREKLIQTRCMYQVVLIDEKMKRFYEIYESC